MRDERIALQAVGDANLGILQGFFRDVRGSGHAALTAAIDGPLREPVFSGRATITGGRVRHFSLPNSLDAINGVMTFDARGIRLDELSATMGGGSVQFGGRIGFDGYEPGELNVTVRGDGVQFRFPEGVRSVVDADLSVRGNVKAPTLGGSVVVKSAVYTKRIDAPETILDFAIRRSSDAGTAEVATVSPVPLRFDIQILVPSTLRIENNLGRGVASADLTLRGTYDRPMFFGHAEVERGELTYKGKRYRVTKGSVDFTNPARIEPFFDIEAETNVRAAGQNYRLVVGATGPTQKLVPSLSSDPSLPAADILALLFSDVRRTEDVELRALQNPTQRQTDLLSASAAETIARPISEAGKIVAAHLRRRYLPAHAVPHRRQQHAGIAAESDRAVDDRQAHLGPRVSDILAKPGLVDQRSDHPARIRRERTGVVDAVAERGFTDLRARVPGEAHLLMRTAAIHQSVRLSRPRYGCHRVTESQRSQHPATSRRRPAAQAGSDIEPHRNAKLADRRVALRSGVSSTCGRRFAAPTRVAGGRCVSASLSPTFSVFSSCSVPPGPKPRSTTSSASRSPPSGWSSRDGRRWIRR